jgi:hypothetical protein
MFGTTECVRVLVEGKADVNAVNIDNETPLYVAVCCDCDTAYLNTLVEAKANVNATNARGETALFDVLLDPTRFPDTRDTQRITSVLFEHDIDLSMQDKYGTTIVEAIRRPVFDITRQVQQCPAWQFMQASGRAPTSERSSATQTQ